MITDELIIDTANRLFKIFNSRQPFQQRDKDDIRQEIYLALIKARDRFDPDRSDWSNYSMAQARFAIADYYRSSPRIGIVWSRTYEEATHIGPLEEWYECEEPEKHDYLDLKEWLDPMSTRERTVSLLLLAGYTQREIGVSLGISEHRIYRTLVDLHIKNSPLSFGLRMDLPPQRQAA